MSGGFNPISMISQAALAVATGGTSLIASMAMQLASSVIKDVISQVAQQLGLPQSVTQGALAAFDAASGNAGGIAQDVGGLLSSIQQQTNANSTQMGQVQNKVDQLSNVVQNLIQQQAQQAAQTTTDGEGNTSSSKTKAMTAASGGSWLMALAEVIGNKLNKAADQMKSDANALDWKDAKQATEFQAETQDFQMLFTTLSNVIKTVGEAEKGMASKQ